MSERYEVVVVGSGAGGGVIAGELADRGRRVLLLEAGPHRTAADYMRWEAHANMSSGGRRRSRTPGARRTPPLILFRGRCVGGTTAINTKVALRDRGRRTTRSGMPAAGSQRGGRAVLRTGSAP